MKILRRSASEDFFAAGLFFRKVYAIMIREISRPFLSAKSKEKEGAFAMQSLCNRWEFVSDWYDGFAVGEGEGERVRLPHTVKEIPQHYADSQSYQMVCRDRKKLTL